MDSNQKQPASDYDIAQQNYDRLLARVTAPEQINYHLAAIRERIEMGYDIREAYEAQLSELY